MSYIHFNRLGGENLLSFNGPHVVGLNITQQPSQGLCTATSAPTSCFRTTQQGYPEGLNVPANFSTLNARVNYIPKDNPSGNVQSWHVSVQREMLPHLLVDVGYVGNKSRDIMILADYNQARPNGPTENATLQARRPIQGFQEIQIAFAGGKGDYHALQVKVERRYSRGLYLLNSFTWSRARDNASGHLEVQNGDNSRVNYRDIEGEFGTSGYDQPLNNTTSFVWELPFGKDRRYGRELNPVVEGLLGGWRVVGINTMTSGVPINLWYSPSADLLRERQPDLPSEPDRRPADAERPADDRELPEPGHGRDPDRPDPAVRQRAAQRRARASVLPVRSRAAQDVRARRRSPHRSAHRSVQPAQQDELPAGQRQPVERQLRHDQLDLRGAADPARREIVFLRRVNSQPPPPPRR